MITKQIKSVETSRSPKPWYEIEIINDKPTVVTDKDGGTNFDASSLTLESIGDINANEPRKDAVYAVTNDGRYICYPEGCNLSADDINLRAHLAWYDADSNEFTVLEFTD